MLEKAGADGDTHADQDQTAGSSPRCPARMPMGPWSWQTCAVAMAADLARKTLLHRGFALEYVTLVWNVVGIAILAIAAVSARSRTRRPTLCAT